jgi:hypothetical protein
VASPLGTLLGMASDATVRVREICTALPGAEERLSHGSPAFFVARQFVMLWPEGHHDLPTPHLWCAAPEGTQQELAVMAPPWFFVPPYVGHRGWLGVLLDGSIGWDELAELCEDAYRTVAPPRWLAVLDAR